MFHYMWHKENSNELFRFYEILMTFLSQVPAWFLLFSRPQDSAELCKFSSISRFDWQLWYCRCLAWSSTVHSPLGRERMQGVGKKSWRWCQSDWAREMVFLTFAWQKKTKNKNTPSSDMRKRRSVSLLSDGDSLASCLMTFSSQCGPWEPRGWALGETCRSDTGCNYCT